MKSRTTLAQGSTEYALILAVTALVILLVVALFGQQLAVAYQKVANSMSSPQRGAGTPAVTSTPAPRSIQAIAQDFMARTFSYHTAHGGWPPTWGTGRFTALGLNPADYQTLVSGIMWNPNGQYIGLANSIGDNVQVYVRDTSGNLLHLYDGWAIWCDALTGVCYYHTMATGTVVTLSTVTVTGN